MALTLVLSVLLLVLDDGTFVAAAVEFVGVDFLAVSPAGFVFTFDFSLSLPLSFWTMFAYDDEAVVDVDVVVDDTFLIVVSSLVAAEVADILSRSPVFFDRRFRLNLVLCSVLSSNQCLGNKTPAQNTIQPFSKKNRNRETLLATILNCIYKIIFKFLFIFSEWVVLFTSHFLLLKKTVTIDKTFREKKKTKHKKYRKKNIRRRLCGC